MCLAFALHCDGHFVVDESNQDSYTSGTLMLGTVNPGSLEPQNFGNLELWNLGALKICKLAILEACNCGILRPAKPWNLA